ncbi:MAG: hypothetical protein GYB67_12465 [Chloroflexi bacterium]|nr:hypothetical protein [Chloroflexota bacterium]
MTSRPPSYYHVFDALKQPGCPFCRLLTRDAHAFIDSLLYEYSMDRGVQQRFQAMRGLCNVHSWQMTTLHGRSSNVAVLQEVVIKALLGVLDDAPDLSDDSRAAGRGFLGGLGGSAKDRAGEQLAARLDAREPCACCQTLDEKEADYVEVFVGHCIPAADGANDPADEHAFTAAYRQSDGFCLPHMRQVLRRTTDRAQVRLIVAVQRAIWSGLNAELETFRLRSGAVGDARDSWRRAIANLTGEQAVFSADRNRS